MSVLISAYLKLHTNVLLHTQKYSHILILEFPFQERLASNGFIALRCRQEGEKMFFLICLCDVSEGQYLLLPYFWWFISVIHWVFHLIVSLYVNWKATQEEWPLSNKYISICFFLSQKTSLAGIDYIVWKWFKKSIFHRFQKQLTLAVKKPPFTLRWL